jgi:hypothetical protein
MSDTPKTTAGQAPDDAEREARIREFWSSDTSGWDVPFLLRLLDEARAEIAQLRKEIGQGRMEGVKAVAIVADERDVARDDIVRLTEANDRLQQSVHAAQNDYAKRLRAPSAVDEARAAALEETAQQYESETFVGAPGAMRIRALAAPPQSEGGEG